MKVIIIICNFVNLQGGEHHHDHNQLDQLVKKLRTKKLEEGASDPHLSKKPRLLWGELLKAVRQDHGEAGLSALGSQESFAKVLNTKRNSKLPPIPRTVDDLKKTEFPEKYRTTDTGGPFLILDTSKESPAPDDEVILGFSSSAQLSVLLESSSWYGDGTFFVSQTSSPPSSQLISFLI